MSKQSLIGILQIRRFKNVRKMRRKTTIMEYFSGKAVGCMPDTLLEKAIRHVRVYETQRTF